MSEHCSGSLLGNAAVVIRTCVVDLKPVALSELYVGTVVALLREREREIYLHEKTAGNQKGKCPSTLVPILNQIINN